MVTLRSRKSKKGKVYYIDYLNNNKRIRETLKIPFSLSNKERLNIANKKRAEKELQLNIKGGFISPIKTLEDVSNEFVRSYKKADYRRIQAGVKSFLRVVDSKLIIDKVTKSNCIEFKDYLMSKYKPDTISNYFKAAKRIFTYAIDREYLIKSPFNGIKNITVPNDVKKEILDLDEIEILKNTECGNDQVKKAFLLACNTGLGIRDCKMLNPKMIRDGFIVGVRGKGRSKPIPLNDYANQIIVSLKNGKFELPSGTAINKCIKKWILKAGIDKHITFYCARHSFATNLARLGLKDRVIRDLLGHSGYKYIDRYRAIIDQEKIDAVNLL